MGIIRSEFRFSNPSKGDLAPIIATALVETGALHLCLPEHLAIQLGL